MYLRFDAEKAIQAVGVLMRLEHKRMTRLRLLKLLIIADRRSLKEMGYPLLGSKVVAMNNGPLHSDVYNLIKGEHIDEPLWSRHFSQDGPRDIVMVEETEIGLLSKAEITLLRNVSEMHEHIDDFELSMLTHGFSEFRKNFREGKSTAIPLEDMLEGVGRLADRQEILQDLKDDAAFDSLFAGLPK